MRNEVDVLENDIVKYKRNLLCVLLKDRTTNENIIWATDDYESRGLGYQYGDHINVDEITGVNGNVIKPRIEKTKEEHSVRIREKAEVFTSAVICNKQINLIDSAWFAKENVFNEETANGWVASTKPIKFPAKGSKKWQDYVKNTRLEISCGEAPYLASRYDAVNGTPIEINQRIGILDRKLRVICENVKNEEKWLEWAYIAFQNIYGYEWQGDNVLLARENLLYTFVDYYKYKFKCEPKVEYLMKIADILSWNIWQMDGIKLVIPGSCKETKSGQIGLFGDDEKKKPCVGCAKNNQKLHTGIYCQVKDWESNKTIKFISLLEEDI